MRDCSQCGRNHGTPGPLKLRVTVRVDIRNEAGDVVGTAEASAEAEYPIDPKVDLIHASNVRNRLDHPLHDAGVLAWKKTADVLAELRGDIETIAAPSSTDQVG